jgi:undecaprenyl-diphosphatase
MGEIDIVIFFNRLWQGTFIDKLTTIVSSYYFLAVVVALSVIAIVFFDKNKKKILTALAASLALYYILAELLLKNIFIRQRPYLAFPSQLIPLGSTITNSSFPSGHATFAVALALPLVYYYRKSWPFALFFVLLVCFARLHNAMHYPSDLIAGLIVGAICGIAGIYISDRLTKKAVHSK